MEKKKDYDIVYFLSIVGGIALLQNVVFAPVFSFTAFYV